MQVQYPAEEEAEEPRGGGLSLAEQTTLKPLCRRVIGLYFDVLMHRVRRVRACFDSNFPLPYYPALAQDDLD
jgi:hypothetical protein